MQSFETAFVSCYGRKSVTDGLRRRLSVAMAVRELLMDCCSCRRGAVEDGERVGHGDGS